MRRRLLHVPIGGPSAPARERDGRGSAAGRAGRAPGEEDAPRGETWSGNGAGKGVGTGREWNGNEMAVGTGMVRGCEGLCVWRAGCVRLCVCGAAVRVEVRAGAGAPGTGSARAWAGL